MNNFATNRLLAVRNGEVPESTVLVQIERWREAIQEAEGESPLPVRPDMARISQWLVSTHRKYWQESQSIAMLSN